MGRVVISRDVFFFFENKKWNWNEGDASVEKIIFQGGITRNSVSPAVSV